MNDPTHALSSLKLETKIICYSGVLLLIVFLAIFLLFWNFQASLQWLLQALLLWCLIIFRTRKIVDLNRPELQQALYPNLGWANRLSLLRAFLIALTGGFVFHATLNDKILLIPALSYFIAAIIDRIDGYIARRTSQESLLGAQIDIESDALGLLIAPLLGVWIGQIHWSYLSVSLAYYLFQWGLYWRSKHNKPVHKLPSNISRRAVAGFQMGFLAVVLWPILTPPATKIAGIAFMLPLLTGFILDWLTVSGEIELDNPPIRKFFKQCNQTMQRVLLPMLRVIIAALLYLSLKGINSLPPIDEDLMLIDPFLLISLVVSGMMILLGINGRFFAIILSCLLCWHFNSVDMHILDGVLLIFVIWVMQLGTGRFSLSIWDDNWVNRYDGA